MSNKKRATIQDVAQLAGVSIKSISRAMNNQPGLSAETRERIFEAMKQLDYVPNPVVQGIRGTSSVIGLVVGELDDYVSQIMRGVAQIANQLHYTLVLYAEFGTEDENSVLPLIGSGLIGGLLMVIPRNFNNLVNLANKYDLPYVLIDYYMGDFSESQTPTITVTNRQSMLEATRYLLALGHREIGIITGMLGMASARERLQGYKDAFTEAGLKVDPLLVMETHAFPLDAYALAKQLLQRTPRPTAIMAFDDATAIEAMAAIRSEGLEVGSDISVIGFDDIPAASLIYPSLTTIRQPMVEMGEAAMELLGSILKGVTPTNLHREFRAELVIRQSTKPPKRSV